MARRYNYVPNVQRTNIPYSKHVASNVASTSQSTPRPVVNNFGKQVSQKDFDERRAKNIICVFTVINPVALLIGRNALVGCMLQRFYLMKRMWCKNCLKQGRDSS